jgi:hypothetical protein
MKHRYLLFFLLCLGLAHLPGYGQQLAEKRVSGNFVHLPFAQFATELESQTGLHVYFAPVAVDS